MQGKYYNEVYWGEMRDSRMDREDQIEMLDDWEASQAKRLAELERAVENAHEELDSYKQWLIGRDMFRQALVESL